MRDLAKKTSFLLLALPAVLRAALRLVWHSRTHGLRELPDKLRDVRPWRPAYLNNPRFLAGSVSRLLSLLPPPGYGPCLKRSFLLLDLWARCGLEPRLHLGMLREGDERRFHAWVTTPGAQAAGEPAYSELWSG